MVWCYWCKQDQSNMGAYASCDPDLGLSSAPIYPLEKKKKTTNLTTWKKKLALKRRRVSKSSDHSRLIRELVSDWCSEEVRALLEEYEASAALKDFTVQANLARPPAPTYKQDLSDLFDFKYCTDVDLVFQGAVFPVHRAILSVRCPYFQKMLQNIPGYGAQIAVDIQTPMLDIPMFSALLRYLYTGEFNPHDSISKPSQMRLNNIDLLMQLCDKFGTPNALDYDLRYLLNSGDYADCVLVFNCHAEYNGLRDSSGNLVESNLPSDYGFSNRLEVYCHKAILSARSPFFRSLIQRRQRYADEGFERGVNQPSRIVLDEEVIPKRYAQVLMQAIYLDTLNLSSILRDSTSTNSLSEAQSIIQTGRTHMTVVEEAMEIYQIGRFLELDILTQGCEDLIVESLSQDNLVSVLKWSGQAHGSTWVHRQALHYLREEFSHIAPTSVLLDLEKPVLVDVLSSDFLQTSELDVLQSVLRWGEHQLIKRMEEREPNLISQTSHSVTRKGLKKKDLNDVELRQILSELLPLVRMDHILPANHEAMQQAIKRGLVSTPPSHMIGDDTAFRVNTWIREKSNGLFVQPRLFTPYAEELKLIVDELASTGTNQYTDRPKCFVSSIPDALYMVHDPPRSSLYTPCSHSEATTSVPVPDSDTVSMMLCRERELVSNLAYQRATSLVYSDRRQMRRQVRLRVVREFNLPDPVADVLEKASFADDDIPTYSDSEQQGTYRRYFVRDEGRSRLQPPEFLMNPSFHSNPYRNTQGMLSDNVPDVAIATSSLSGLQLSSRQSHRDRRSSIPGKSDRHCGSMGSLEGLGHEKCLGLDLGDGAVVNSRQSVHQKSSARPTGVFSLHRRHYSSQLRSDLPAKGLSCSLGRYDSNPRANIPHSSPLRHYATVGPKHYNVATVSSPDNSQLFL